MSVGGRRDGAVSPSHGVSLPHPRKPARRAWR